MWKGILAVVVSIPIAAFLVASAFVGMAIADNWDRATTASLVTGLVAVCGGGLVVVSLIVGLVVGMPFAIRLFFEAGVARRAFDSSGPVVTYPPGRQLPPPVVTYPPGRQLPPPAGRQWQEETPPQLTDRQSGSWQSSGPEAYRLWEEEPVEADRNNW